MGSVKGVLWLSMLAACGRLGFDARGDGGGPGDAQSDAPPKFFIDGGQCPPSYTFDTMGCYRPYIAGPDSSWVDAEHLCEQDGFGVHLAVIDLPGEAAILDRQVPGTIIEHWIGNTDIVTEGSFVDVFGRGVTYTNWGSAEPSGGTTKNCVTFFDNTTIATKDCAGLDGFVCEYDGMLPVPAAWGQ